MKSIFSFTLLFFLFSKSFGQIDFKGDSVSTDNFSRLSFLIDSAYKLDKTYDFEFRLWTNPSLVTYTNVFILSQKNKIWTARFFEYNGNQKQKLSEKTVDQSKLDSLWARLTVNQVLTLPSQDSLKNKMKIFVADTSYVLDEEDTYKRLMMTDGAMYYFELATQNKRRSYSYHCPQGYSKLYPNIEELYRAYAIIILVRKYLGLKLTVC
jgi:hypothetical protein